MLARSETLNDLSTAASARKTPNDLSIAGIDRRRRELGVPLMRLIRAAGIDTATWYAGLRNPESMRETTRRRLSTALDALMGSAPAARPPAVIAAFVRLAEAELGRMLARDKRLRRDVAGHATQVGAGRLRRLAVYVIAVELEVENAELARALACSRQNIHQARLAVEQWRDKPRIDRMLDAARLLVRGQ